MSFPGPGWQAVADKAGVYVHNDTPACEVEATPTWCPGCQMRGITMHAICGCPDHFVESATVDKNRRADHALHTCGRTVDVVPLGDDGEPQWPVVLP